MQRLVDEPIRFRKSRVVLVTRSAGAARWPAAQGIFILACLNGTTEVVPRHLSCEPDHSSSRLSLRIGQF
jgi:hypothetical protein